jgi:hypothetical protein
MRLASMLTMALTDYHSVRPYILFDQVVLDASMDAASLPS